MVRAPQNPEVLTAVGRLYRAQGKTAKATEYFSAAVTAEQQQRMAQLAASGSLNQVRSQNPFANRQQWQQQRSPFTPLGGGGIPAAVPVGTTLMAPQPEPMRFAPVATLGYTPAAMPIAQQPLTQAPVAQPLIPEPAGSGRSALMLAQAAASAPPAPVPTTPGNYVQQTYQPAPLANVPSGVNAAVSAPVASQRSGSRRSSVAETTPSTTAVPMTAAASTRGTTTASPSAASPTDSVLPPSSAGLISPAQAAALANERIQPNNAGPAAVIPAPVSTYSSSAPPVPANGLAWAPSLRTGQDGAVQVAQNNLGLSAPNRSRSALDDLTEIRQDRIPVVSLGLVARTREGESGLSQLTDIEAPLQLKFDAGDGKLILRITPTSLSAGAIDSAYGTLSRFGGGPDTALNLPTQLPGSQNASGIGLAVGYETGRLRVDVGTTPLGFNHSDITGGVKYRMPLGEEVALTIDASRRPVIDSLLSFAGTKDARTGDSWGGVSSTGGRLDLNWETGDFGVYGYGSLYGLTGTNVASNSRVEGGGGLYWRISQTANSGFTAGMNVSALSYNKNLRYFTYGQGGYFSPQRFMSMGVPLEWAQRTNRLSYQIKGSLGIQNFREDSSAYFPTNSSRQAAAVLAASNAFAFGTAGATSTGAVYPGQSKTGLGYNLGAAMEYQIHPQLFFGGQLALDNARDYRQFIGAIYLRYALQPYSGMQALPINPLRSPYGADF